MLDRKNMKEEGFILAHGLSYQGGEGVTADRSMAAGVRLFAHLSEDHDTEGWG